MPHRASDAEESLLSNYSPYMPNAYINTRRLHNNRRRILPVCLSLTALALTTLLVLSWSQQRPDQSIVASEPIETEDASKPPSVFIEPPKFDPLDPRVSLKGPPTPKFRDNLRPELQYITSWISAGWTNDVMTYANLIYLGLITDRIPVIPIFMPTHMDGALPTIPFSEVFDLPRLRQLLGKPVLEWREVKDRESNIVEDLGCWNIWEAVHMHEKHPRISVVAEHHLKLDLSYTKAPDYVKLIPGFEHDLHATFWSLATLAFPESRKANLVPPLESSVHHVSLPPDEQMLCYDYLYYVCAHKPHEWETDYSPAWRYVGQHMHWTKRLEDIAELAVRETLGVSDGAPTPPWITIHARHTDFQDLCYGVPIHECYASISTIARRVSEVKAELHRKGIAVEHVIMTSDEKDPAWWQEVAEQGWYRVNHQKITEAHGQWYTLFVDVVIQSSGKGFVGTDGSTMSLLAQRRVETWHNGVTAQFKWGTPAADDH
ncbi:hypothetical protein HGRIS_003053 [Hohenbuehelia grisea]|uniref:Uncharacterized protein n=1 Tax=Hohenbuehelia grisea TaxID=104357 RepID=A0ABR3JMI2_9AGAR